MLAVNQQRPRQSDGCLGDTDEVLDVPREHGRVKGVLRHVLELGAATFAREVQPPSNGLLAVVVLAIPRNRDPASTAVGCAGHRTLPDGLGSAHPTARHDPGSGRRPVARASPCTPSVGPGCHRTDHELLDRVLDSPCPCAGWYRPDVPETARLAVLYFLHGLRRRRKLLLEHRGLRRGELSSTRRCPPGNSRILQGRIRSREHRSAPLRHVWPGRLRRRLL